MHHPLYSDGRGHEPDIDLRTYLESFSPNHNHVCEGLKPKHGVYYFVLGNSGGLRYRNPRTRRVVDSGELDGLNGERQEYS